MIENNNGHKINDEQIESVCLGQDILGLVSNCSDLECRVDKKIFFARSKNPAKKYHEIFVAGKSLEKAFFDK